MIFGDNNQRFGDDFFESTRMSFGDHIEDLRKHLIRAIVGFVVALIIAFPLAFFVVMPWIRAPVEAQLEASIKRRIDAKIKEIMADPNKWKPRIEEMKVDIRFILMHVKNEKAAAKKPVWLNMPVEVTPKAEDFQEVEFLTLQLYNKLVVLSVQEGLMVWIQVSLVTGLVIGSPWIFIQIWAFIAAGLYPHERKIINRYLPFAIFLFLGGIFFCYFIVLPKAIDALLYFNEMMNLTPQIRLSEWLGFAIWVPVIFGISFETPLVMMAIERVGIATVDMFRQWRKFAWLGMFIAAAVFTPTGDPITFLYLAIPMCLFYELGIVLCRFNKRKSGFDLDVPDDEEMVEV